eukprot:1583925-Pleurochrysis_carterae.AAC.1
MRLQTALIKNKIISNNVKKQFSHRALDPLGRPCSLAPNLHASSIAAPGGAASESGAYWLLVAQLVKRHGARPAAQLPRGPGPVGLCIYCIDRFVYSSH